MAKRIVLRVDSTISLTDAQLIEIAEKSGVPLTEQNIQREELSLSNQTKLFKERFAGVCAGANFLLDRLLEDKPCRLSIMRQNALRSYLTQLEVSYEKAINNPTLSLKDRQSILHEHACLLTSCFALSLKETQDYATHWLSKAEEYHLLIEPRDELMTLKAIETNGSLFYMLQQENHLPALSDTLLDDYWAVHQQTSPLPEWYTQLAPMEQHFLLFTLQETRLKATLQKVLSRDDLRDLFVNFSSRLRSIPGMANFRKHSISLLDSELMVLMEDERYASSMVSSRDIQKESVTQSVRDHHARTNIEHIIDTALPSLVNKKLAQREFSEGSTVHVELHMALQSLISPGIPEKFQPDAKLHADKIRVAETLNYHREEPWQAHNNQGEKTSINIIIDMHLQPTNHPLNDANKFGYTSFDEPGCLAFITTAHTFLEDNPTHKNHSDITHLIEEYGTLLRSGGFLHANIHDTNKRELYLSSLEQLLTLLQGNLPYGSCVSGKDRKALELMHTDAMLIYHRLYDNWPSYSDEENLARSHFVNIFSSLYLSHHHHISAALNSPGSEGIKTPENYLPKDIITNLNAYYVRLSPNGESSLTADDAFASFNELKSITKYILNISDSSYQKKAEAKLWYIELQLSNQSTQESITKNTYITESWNLIDELTSAKSVDLKKFWDSNTSYKADMKSAMRILGLFNTTAKPKGIKEISTVMKHSEGEINEQLLVQLNAIVQKRLETTTSLATTFVRYPDTEKLYTLLQHLLDISLNKEHCGGGESPSIYNGLCQLHATAKGYPPKAICTSLPLAATPEAIRDESSGCKI